MSIGPRREVPAGTGGDWSSSRSSGLAITSPSDPVPSAARVALAQEVSALETSPDRPSPARAALAQEVSALETLADRPSPAPAPWVRSSLSRPALGEGRRSAGPWVRLARPPSAAGPG